MTNEDKLFWCLSFLLCRLFVACSAVGENPEEPHHVWVLSGAWCVWHKWSFSAGDSLLFKLAHVTDTRRMFSWFITGCSWVGKEPKWNHRNQWHGSFFSGADIETTANFRQEWWWLKWSNEWHSCTGKTYLPIDQPTPLNAPHLLWQCCTCAHRLQRTPRQAKM